MNSFVVWIGLVVALASGGAARESAGAESTLVRVGYGGIAGYQLPLWVVKEAGISFAQFRNSWVIKT
jgi:hypothetical protein